MVGKDIRGATRETVVPEELQAALAKNKVAAASYDAMSASHQREYAAWVAGAKRPETRASRAERALAMILVRAH